MIDVSEEAFGELVARGIESIPAKFIERLRNVAIVVADAPTEAQRRQMHLGSHMTLYGLYEGVPLTARGEYYSLVSPDKITIFRLPMLERAQTLDEVKEMVRNTVWHEIAHHFGMDELEVRRREHEEGRER